MRCSRPSWRSLPSCSSASRWSTAVFREHYPIAVDGEVVGHVTTGMKSPTLDKFVGLGYVPRDHSKIGTEIDILVRGAPKRAVIVKRPFYKPQYKRD